MACILTLRMVGMIHHKTFYKKEIQAMKKPSTVLGNLLSLFPRSDFEKAVLEFGGDHRVRTLSTWDFLKTLIYGQISSSFSVRDIEASLKAQGNKLYHCGLKPIKRTTLCDAMESRDPRIFERTFEALVNTAQRLGKNSGRKFKNPLKIIDGSTIELCLSRFNWAKFRTTKGAVKLHVALNGDGFFPQQVMLTTGSVHEVNKLLDFELDQGDLVVFDRGYIDYKRLHDIHLERCIFVTRMKDNCQYEVFRRLSSTKTKPVRLDEKIKLTSDRGRENYPDKLRRIEYHDEKHDVDYVFMTNDFTRPAQEIADIYKARWQVELFFKWIKQNLKIKTFLGTSINAVYTQIWVALIVYLLLWINQTIHGIGVSLQRIMQILKTTLLGSGTIWELLHPPERPQQSPSGQIVFWGPKN